MPPEEDRATAIDNMQKNFWKIADRQKHTHRQTCSSKYSAPLTDMDCRIGQVSQITIRYKIGYLAQGKLGGNVTA